MAIDTSDENWWRTAVVYQVYPRSFADGNGDGIGDIAGIRSKLPYLKDLGIDAIWINPWYPSPMHDAGYDVADFRNIEPLFGTLDDAKALLAEAHDAGIRILLDIVPNHTSDDHAWFQEALASEPRSPARARYHFHDGKGPNGDEVPNDWTSEFGGPAWTRSTNADGTPGQWYLHLFAPEQPDVNWDNSEVRAEFLDVLRFWFDLGVDGFRIDVGHGMDKDPNYGDKGAFPDILEAANSGKHPHWDRDGVHPIYREWRKLAESYEPKRVFAGEIWVGSPERLARYLRADELHTAFNFDYLVSPWRADQLRESIDDTIATHAAVGAPPTWVLSNHDVPREVSKYARPSAEKKGRLTLSDLLTMPADFAQGQRRARAAALLMLALPGGAYIYQGEELGLAEVEDLPDDVLQDPTFVQSQGKDKGRDGCRVPIPWEGDAPNFGFGAGDPWLPQPAEWKDLAADTQDGDPESMLTLYRAALQDRHLFDGDLQWDQASDAVLQFTRGEVTCIVNFGEEPLELPEGAILLASGPTPEGKLPGDTAAWIRSA